MFYESLCIGCLIRRVFGDSSSYGGFGMVVFCWHLFVHALDWL